MQTRAFQLSTGSRTLPNRFLSQDCLLPDVIRDLRQFPLIRCDRREVIGLSDQVERSKRFPHLVAGGIDDRDLGSCRYILARLNKEVVNSAGDG